jgi:hypothetical protein
MSILNTANINLKYVKRIHKINGSIDNVLTNTNLTSFDVKNNKIYYTLSWDHKLYQKDLSNNVVSTIIDYAYNSVSTNTFYKG